MVVHDHLVVAVRLAQRADQLSGHHLSALLCNRTWHGRQARVENGIKNVKRKSLLWRCSNASLAYFHLHVLFYLE